MRFSIWVFKTAGIYGLVVLLPQYFVEAQVTAVRGAFVYPEYFYGFVGIAIAWQVAFLIIAKDPVRYRPLMIPSILEKITFAGAVVWLYSQGRVPATLLVPAGIDLLLAGFFAAAYVKLGRARAFIISQQ